MISRMIVWTAAVVVGLLLARGSALAHPHVWVTVKSTVSYAPDGRVIGVRHAWTFDDMFSAFAVQGLDSKQKGAFTREELAPLAKVNVESLKEYDYFTYAKANGKNASFVDPKDYYLEYDSKAHVLTLHFLLPLKAPVTARTLDLEIYDPTYFVDFGLAKDNPVSLAGASPGCELSVAKRPEPSADVVRTLAQIPADEQVPANSYGALFSNKIAVKCP